MRSSVLSLPALAGSAFAAFPHRPLNDGHIPWNPFPTGGHTPNPTGWNPHPTGGSPPPPPHSPPATPSPSPPQSIMYSPPPLNPPTHNPTMVTDYLTTFVPTSTSVGHNGGSDVYSTWLTTSIIANVHTPDAPWTFEPIETCPPQSIVTVTKIPEYVPQPVTISVTVTTTETTTKTETTTICPVGGGVPTEHPYDGNGNPTDGYGGQATPEPAPSPSSWGYGGPGGPGEIHTPTSNEGGYGHTTGWASPTGSYYGRGKGWWARKAW
ncbi:hypothetical protein EJ05DRAFT_364869 [Pseudovirgaria hyperparasitica]|uniref:Uncharacterized protein n=1 Tax=Pseudovirgaria hyperparasitica TaxID=470096 RepID=A0A6A6W834_9PEZI|nr:uncharacterized protein EJ05DRAFT_364869 [Pseudovirgaria hyperparasitica]KAF2758803.1 hypothetical protein EJ05DRAFT_364869 [Pseudovirgaria hyperparasitica]